MTQEALATKAAARWRWALVAVLTVAALLRLPGLAHAPPGLNQDEASNAWNAYCLLRTGHDQSGAFPIFYTRALGDYRSALFLYTLLPFQALGGLNLWTTRLPAAAGGLLTILLTFWVGRRLFGRAIALTAAALLAIDPMHIQVSRLGFEASHTPLLTLLPLALLLWAGFPLDDDPQPRPRPRRALFAGLLTGICCYGYPAVRLFLPLFLAACVLVNAGAWWRAAQARRGKLAILALFVGVAATFGPLAYQHLRHPDLIARRGEKNWIWRETDPWPTKLATVWDRYVRHYEFDFLYHRGDANEIVFAAGFGFLLAYLLPLQLVGLAWLVPRLWRSRAARVLAVGIGLYPAADLLNWYVSLHALRSLPGLIPLLLLAAIGFVRPLEFLLRHRLRTTLLVSVVAVAASAIDVDTRFLSNYVFDRPRQPAVYGGDHMDLVEACAWLRPQLDQVDVVICTTFGMNQPYTVTLVALGHDPRQWFAEPRIVNTVGHWDYYERYGKFYFGQEREQRILSEQSAHRGRPIRVVFFLRPTEPAPAEPVHHIIGPEGKPTLLIYDVVR